MAPTPTHSFLIPNELIDEAREALGLEPTAEKSYVVRLALIKVSNSSIPARLSKKRKKADE